MTPELTELSAAKRRLVRRMLDGAGAPSPRRIERASRRDDDSLPAPVSVEQRQVWLHAAMADELPLYNEPITIHRRGSFDLTRLQESFNAVLRRHDIWRTAFAIVNGALRQVVQRELCVILPLVDLSRMSESGRERKALELATEDARARLEIFRAPLFRARVIKLAADDHRLHLTLHHIIFDGVSIYRIFLPELIAEYEARGTGGRARDCASTLQYADYALWRNRTLAETAPQLAYWRAQLAGDPPRLRLPCDCARPARISYRGGMEAFALPPGLTQALKTVARTEQATLYMVLLAVFKVLLHRYSGLEDIVIGGAVDMRRRPELQRVMGYFLNSVALRSRPSGTLTFRDYLEQVKGIVLDAVAASDVPFEHVVRELRPPRDASHHPFFDVLFSMEPPAPALPEGWDLTQMEVTVGTAKFDLYLELDESPDGIIGRFIYSTDLFEAPTIRRMIGHWVRLLQSVVATPKARLMDLPMLTPEESRRLLIQWNATTQEVPSTTLPAWFEEQVRRAPDRIAVKFEKRSLTYRELDRCAEALAARLRATGIGRERLVGVFLERSLEMIVALLAVLKSGAAYLPLDPGLPRARIDLVVRDARCSALVTSRALLTRLPDLAIPVLDLEDRALPCAPSSTYPGPADPSSLAYVLYTSGSTGQPKGVEVCHRSIVNLLRSIQDEPGFNEGETLLAVTALSFDIAALEIFLPLVTGGTVVLASSATVGDPAALARLIRESRCTMMQATPTLWRSLVDANWPGRPNLTVLSGGEALSSSLADALLARSGRLWNLYGPTETTVWSTLHRVASQSGAVPIGRPIANTRVYVLDPGGSLVPVGVPGELYIAGVGLARGYRNHDVLTRERFVARRGVPGERLYRTGDLARWRADGTLEFLGRTDAQLKIRGFRVAPEEVEAALESHPDIAAAAVTAARERGGQSLIAYVVPRGARTPGAQELRRHLAQVLPSYLIPAWFATVPSLPATPNGKLDRNRLPAIPRSEPIAGIGTLQTPPERRLAAMWREILDVSEVGPEDDFFELGGHSLLVVNLLRRIEASFGVRLPMAALLEAPTLGRMARLVSAQAQSVLPSAARHEPGLIWVNAAALVRHLGKSLAPHVPMTSVAVPPDALLRLGDAPSLSAIAALVVNGIRAIQPDGPYRLGGWCTDGILAFETAAQLMRQGAVVELLVLVHSVNPVHFHRLGTPSIQFSKFRYYWQKLRELRGAARWSYAAARFRGAIEPATPWLREASILHNAALAYEPSTYPGSVLLLQPAERPAILDYGPGWADVVTGRLTIRECPGDHCSMLEPPHVDVVARRIREQIGSAIQPQRAAHGAG